MQAWKADREVLLVAPLTFGVEQIEIVFLVFLVQLSEHLFFEGCRSFLLHVMAVSILVAGEDDLHFVRDSSWQDAGEA